jgi:hypothetical protein
MTNRKAALVPANVATDETSLNRVDVIARLSVANAKERILILSALPMGEIAAIGGKVANIGASVNEALNIKMVERHGADWVQIFKTAANLLSDANKERRKAINASLESIRETVKANTGGRDDIARNTVRRVKEWGEGKRQSKSAPKANAKRGLQDFLLSWDAMPSIYRRIMKDEGANDTDMALGDAIAAYFTAHNIKPSAVLDCAGRSGWNK